MTINELRVVADLEEFLEDEYKRLTAVAQADSIEAYFIAEVVLIRAKLKSILAKHGYEN